MKFRIAIFASGSGTNAINFIQYFKTRASIEIAGVYCNNPNAGVIDKARNLGVEVVEFERAALKNGDVTFKLIEDQTDYVVLAGFLWLIPINMITAFPSRIINIHPALLPKFGGKGMFGQHVHQAVIDQKEHKSGITIHLVDEVYDHGKYLFQAEVPIDTHENVASLAAKIHLLEQAHYPKVVEKYILEGERN